MRTRQRGEGIFQANDDKASTREFYTVSQLADLLQLNEMTLYRMVKTGRMSCHLIGRVMRFRHDDIEEFLKQHRVAASKRKD